MTEACRQTFGNPFRAPGRWWKGNLHVHTSNSDGALTPADMAARYRQAGYDFICLTDHGKVTPIDGLSSEEFLVIPGEEGSAEGFDLVEVNVKRSFQPLARQKGAQALIDAVRAEGGEVILAHPYFSALGTEDPVRLSGYLGLEVFNTSVEHNLGKGNSAIYWDYLLARGESVLGFATDDAHWHFNDHRPNDTAVSSVMVKAPALAVSAILDALRRGLFYSTTGPIIHDIALDGPRLTVKSSPVRSINFIARGGAGERFTALGDSPLAHAAYTLKGKERYVRVECADALGRAAWSNPFFGLVPAFVKGREVC